MSYALTPLKTPRKLAADDMPCIVVALNERLRLPDVLRHHRAIGATRFLIIDNGSNDGTVEYLQSVEDVDLWHTLQPFSEALAGVAWQNEISRIYGRHRWYLVIDSDELFVYPGMENDSLRIFSEKLAERGIIATRAPLIDMYPQGKIFDCDYSPGDNLLATCPYFDGDSYRYQKIQSGGMVLIGGPRARIISNQNENFQNVLDKYPLRFWRNNEEFTNIHLHPACNTTFPPLAALLHFKFLSDFEKKIDEAIVHGQHWRNSLEYRKYQANLDLLSSPFNANSVRYLGPSTLIERKIMFPLRNKRPQQVNHILR